LYADLRAEKECERAMVDQTQAPNYTRRGDPRAHLYDR
jgi:hypothetical protein